jgi:hypothetical protein
MEEMFMRWGSRTLRETGASHVVTGPLVPLILAKAESARRWAARRGYPDLDDLRQSVVEDLLVRSRTLKQVNCRSRGLKTGTARTVADDLRRLSARFLAMTAIHRLRVRKWSHDFAVAEATVDHEQFSPEDQLVKKERAAAIRAFMVLLKDHLPLADRRALVEGARVDGLLVAVALGVAPSNDNGLPRDSRERKQIERARRTAARLADRAGLGISRPIRPRGT